MDTHSLDSQLNRKEYAISLEDQKKVLGNLESRTDPEALRIKRYLSMPDLSRTPGSPLYEIVERARNVSVLKNFDNVIIPEIVPASISFDLFDFAPDHPARSSSDTYYADDKNILRTHDTVMWYYYLNLPEIKARIVEKKPLGVVCYGKVFRKDEIDRRHMNIFHQFGGLYLVPDEKMTLTLDVLRDALTEVVKGLFGSDVKYRFLDDTFPYTDPSLQVEVWVGPGEPSTQSSDEVGPDGGKWVEILGGGMPKKSVLKKMGLEGYHGWAFGFGLERLAIIGMELPDIRLLWSTDERVKKQLHLGQKFVEVSKYPPVVRDISFIVPKTFAPNNYFDLVRDIAGDLVEQVELIDEYENAEKFGADKKSYAYRVTYRANDRTLTNEEVDVLHKKLEEATVKEFQATVR
jgi:phenylalanyl-tRNA synthetase alpha chain